MFGITIEENEGLCKAVDKQLKFMYADFNQTGISAVVGGIMLDCTTPRVPLSMGLIDYMFKRTAECMLSDLGCLEGWKVSSVFLLENSFKGFEDPLDAERYWARLGMPAPNIILYVKHEDGRKAFLMVLLSMSTIMPGMKPMIHSILGLNAPFFNQMHGVAGSDTPALLSHYERYDVEGGAIVKSSKEWFEE